MKLITIKEYPNFEDLLQKELPGYDVLPEQNISDLKSAYDCAKSSYNNQRTSFTFGSSRRSYDNNMDYANTYEKSVDLHLRELRNLTDLVNECKRVLGISVDEELAPNHVKK